MTNNHALKGIKKKTYDAVKGIKPRVRKPGKINVGSLRSGYLEVWRKALYMGITGKDGAWEYLRENDARRMIRFLQQFVAWSKGKK